MVEIRDKLVGSCLDALEKLERENDPEAGALLRRRLGQVAADLDRTLNFVDVLLNDPVRFGNHRALLVRRLTLVLHGEIDALEGEREQHDFAKGGLMNVIVAAVLGVAGGFVLAGAPLLAIIPALIAAGLSASIIAAHRKHTACGTVLRDLRRLLGHLRAEH